MNNPSLVIGVVVMMLVNLFLFVHILEKGRTMVSKAYLKDQLMVFLTGNEAKCVFELKGDVIRNNNKLLDAVTTVAFKSQVERVKLQELFITELNELKDYAAKLAYNVDEVKDLYIEVEDRGVGRLSKLEEDLEHLAYKVDEIMYMRIEAEDKIIDRLTKLEGEVLRQDRCMEYHRIEYNASDRLVKLEEVVHTLESQLEFISSVVDVDGERSAALVEGLKRLAGGLN